MHDFQGGTTTALASRACRSPRLPKGAPLLAQFPLFSPFFPPSLFPSFSPSFPSLSPPFPSPFPSPLPSPPFPTSMLGKGTSVKETLPITLLILSQPHTLRPKAFALNLRLCIGTTSMTSMTSMTRVRNRRKSTKKDLLEYLGLGYA